MEVIMHRIKKNFRILRELIRLRFHNIMVFRLDFFGPFIVDGSLFIIQLLVFNAVYSRVDSIGTWEKGEMILYIGTFSLLNAINMVVYFFGVNQIQYKVKSGEMDLYLTKPVSALFRLTFEQINPGSIPLVIMSLLIIAYGVVKAQIVLSVQKVLVYIFWLFLMTVLYYIMEVVIRSVSLYIISNARMDELEGAGLSLCMQLPGIAFYGIYKIIFYFILPYGIMATLPVQSLVGEMTWKEAVIGIGVTLFFIVFGGVLWKNGLKHYHSASS